jgi:hypothetical protein
MHRSQHSLSLLLGDSHPRPTLQGCGFGDSDNYVDECIANSNIVKAAAATDGVKSGRSVNDLLQNNLGNDDNLLGMIITTKQDGCCPSNRLRLISSEVTSDSCYEEFWAFQCVNLP